MNDFDQELSARLAQIREAGLWRELRRVDSALGTRIRLADRELLNFASNDYLGLANHPALREAAAKAARDFGAGSGASRLICGSLAPHHELEEALAAFKGTEAALAFTSGYAAAIGVITALLGKDDVVAVDKRVHACCIDAARLSGAKLRVFAHNDLDGLESILRWAAARPRLAPRASRALIVTESVFSMDGDLAPLKDIADLKDRHGAWLMVDEAHATGLFGEHRRGVAEAFGVADRVEVQMGTLGKSFGSAGGYIAGSRPLVDLLVNRARSFIFSTAPVPAAAAAATAGVGLVQGEEGADRCRRSWRLVDRLKNSLIEIGQAPGLVQSAILPLLTGEETLAVALAENLRERGVFVPAIRYPTVARGAARLRLTMTASHTAEDIAELCVALRLSHPALRPSP